MVYLSVIIPAYNEEGNFNRGCLNSVLAFMRRQKYFWEVILVNDGSTDNTGKLLKDFVKRQQGKRALNRIRYLYIRHAGKQAAIEAGIKTSKGKIVMFTDFDQSTPINQVAPAIKLIEKGADIVVGNRFSGKMTNFQGRFYYLRSSVFSFFRKMLLGNDIPDTQCGFKIFRRPVAIELFNAVVAHKTKPITKPYMGAFDAELVYIALKKGYCLYSLPVTFTRFASGRHCVSEPLEMGLSLLKIRLFDLLGYYSNSKF